MATAERFADHDPGLLEGGDDVEALSLTPDASEPPGGGAARSFGETVRWEEDGYTGWAGLPLQPSFSHLPHGYRLDPAEP